MKRLYLALALTLTLAGCRRMAEAPEPEPPARFNNQKVGDKAYLVTDTKHGQEYLVFYTYEGGVAVVKVEHSNRRNP